MTRRSVRKYQPQAVNRDTMQIIVECGINAPNAINRQAWEVRIVDNPEVIQKLTDLYLKDNPNEAENPNFKTIDFFSESGVSQHVLSASELSMLKKQLEGFGILECFESVSGLDNIHAHSKSELARTWREAHPDAKVLVIGDTEHDAETARLLRADCALICGGHQTCERLLECKGAKVYDSLRDLCDFLSKQ